MTKLVIILLGAIIAAIVSEARRRGARSRLREIDEGARCVACDGTDLTRDAVKARCNRCGYVASLSRIAAVKVDEKAVDQLVKPDDWSRD